MTLFIIVCNINVCLYKYTFILKVVIVINILGNIQQVFKVLSDENRLKIVEALSKECESVNEIARKAGISQPLASHHLKTLKNAGLARYESRGRFNFYWIADEMVWEIIEKCKEFVTVIEGEKIEEEEHLGRRD